MESIREITGYLEIGGFEVKNLSFLGNLKTIIGQELTSDGMALSISDTGIESVELASLKHIQNGHIRIGGNQNLCLFDGNYFNDILSSEGRIYMGENRPLDECGK